MTHAVDIDIYLARLGLEDRPAHSLEGLACLQATHLQTVPFESFDVALGRPISLDPKDLFDKIVRRRRGGYCFELNGLFGALLDALGFTRHAVPARVWYHGAREAPAETHTLNLVRLDGENYLVDVGFGGQTPRLPLPFRDGFSVRDVDGVVSVRHHPAYGMIVSRHGEDDGGDDERIDQFSTDGRQAYGSDLLMANHYVSTHPASVFTGPGKASLFTPEGRWTLLGRTLACRRGLAVEQEVLGSAEAYRRALASRFGVELGEQDCEALYDQVADAG